MAKDVIMPVLGMNQDTAVLLSWLKREGEQVVEGEPIMEVETDKATMELDAPASGTLARVTVAAGDEVKVGSVVAVILAEGEETAEPPAAGAPGPRSDAAQERGAGTPPTDAASTRAAPSAAGRSPVIPPAQTPPALAHPGPYRLTPASPKARRLASERGLDVAVLDGSGPEGAVLAADVLRAAERVTRPASAAVDRPHAPAGWTEFVREVDAAPLLAVVRWARRQAGDTAGVDVGDLLARFLMAVWVRYPLSEGGDGLRYRRVADGSVSEVRLEPGGAGLTAIVDARQAAPNAATAATGLAPALSLLDLTRARADLADGGAPHEGVVSLVAGRLTERVLAVDGAPVARTALTLRLAFDRSSLDLAAAAAWADHLLELVEDPSALALLY